MIIDQRFKGYFYFGRATVDPFCTKDTFILAIQVESSPVLGLSPSVVFTEMHPTNVPHLTIKHPAIQLDEGLIDDAYSKVIRPIPNERVKLFDNHFYPLDFQP